MDIVVTQDAVQPQRGTLIFDGRAYACALGRAGINAEKHEGDGATPVGRFPLRWIFYRADRMAAPKTVLPARAIAPADGWCDAPDDANYNKPVTLPYPASTEAMWRDDGLYDVVVVVGHNDAPVVRGAGSAIFLHVAPRDFGPTAGCVALARDDLLELLSKIDSTTSLDIRGAA